MGVPARGCETTVAPRAVLLVVLLEEVHKHAARQRAAHRPLADHGLSAHGAEADAEEVARLVELAGSEPGVHRTSSLMHSTGMVLEGHAACRTPHAARRTTRRTTRRTLHARQRSRSNGEGGDGGQAVRREQATRGDRGEVLRAMPCPILGVPRSAHDLLGVPRSAHDLLGVPQVLNLRSSIKVAEDFVSPEHIGRCLELTEQFRALPRGHRRQARPRAPQPARTRAAATDRRRLARLPPQEDQLGAKDIILHAVRRRRSVGPCIAPGLCCTLCVPLAPQPHDHSAHRVRQVSHALSVRGLAKGAEALSESSDDDEDGV